MVMWKMIGKFEVWQGTLQQSWVLVRWQEASRKGRVLRVELDVSNTVGCWPETM
jgi:hypothetical protein